MSEFTGFIVAWILVGMARHMETQLAKRNYVANIPVTQAAPPLKGEIVHTINAAPLATQHVEVKTSAVDRAKGFLIASVPLYLTFAAAVVAVVVFGFSVPLASLATLTIFFLSFTAAWVVGYCYTLQTSAEGVALYEAKQKWATIRDEQRWRWGWYERQIEGKQ